MRITESQALNIVRTYNKQLRVGSLGQNDSESPKDKVSLSAEARRLGSQVSPEADVPAHDGAATPSVETRVKSHAGVSIQRNLPFD